MISQALIDWAAEGRWSVRVPRAAGEATFWDDPDGEARFFIGAGRDGWVDVWVSHRGGGRREFLSVASSELVEFFFTGYFGGRVREKRGLPLLDIPFDPGGLAPGFAVVGPDAEGKAVLTGPDGAPVAKSGPGEMGVGNLVELSQYLAAPSAEALKAAFLDPGGEPLFSPLRPDAGRTDTDRG